MYPSPLPMPIPSTPLSQHIAETVRQVGESVEDLEDEKEDLMLVTTVAPGPHSEGCLLVAGEKFIHLPMVHSLRPRAHCTRSQD